MALSNLGNGPRVEIRLEDLVNAQAQAQGVDPSQVDRNALIEGFSNPWTVTPYEGGRKMFGGGGYTEGYDPSKTVWENMRAQGLNPIGSGNVPMSYTVNPIVQKMLEAQGLKPEMVSGLGEESGEGGRDPGFAFANNKRFVKGFTPVKDAQGNVIGWNTQGSGFEPTGFKDLAYDVFMDALPFAVIPAAAYAAPYFGATPILPEAAAAATSAAAPAAASTVAPAATSLVNPLGGGGLLETTLGGLPSTGLPYAAGGGPMAALPYAAGAGPMAASAPSWVDKAAGFVKDVWNGKGFPFPKGSTAMGLASLGVQGIMGNMARNDMKDAYGNALNRLAPYSNPDPASDPYLQSAMGEIRKQIEAGAASKGMLNSGRTLQEISDATFSRGYLPWRGQNIGAASAMARLDLGKGEADAQFMSGMADNVTTFLQSMGAAYDKREVMNSDWFKEMMKDIKKLDALQGTEKLDTARSA